MDIAKEWLKYFLCRLDEFIYETLSSLFYLKKLGSCFVEQTGSKLMDFCLSLLMNQSNRHMHNLGEPFLVFSFHDRGCHILIVNYCCIIYNKVPETVSFRKRNDDIALQV